MNMAWHVVWALGNSLWQSALIALVAAVALKFFRKSTAALRYGIWGAVLLSTAVLPVIDLAIPAPTVELQTLSTGSTWSSAPVAHAAPMPAALDARQTGLKSIGTSPVVSAHATVPSASAAWHESAPGTADASPASASATMWTTVGHAAARGALFVREASERVAPVALWIWTICAALLVLRLGFGLFRLYRIKAGLAQIADRRILPRTGNARRVTIGTSDAVDCPCVIGYARPAIALPSAFLEGLTPADLDRVLAHELAHVRRFDDWANLLQQCIRALFCANPVVHVACWALDVDREIACDDLVAAQIADRIEYAKCLTEIARRTTFAQHVVPAAGFFPSRRQIIVRVERLLDREHNGSARVGLVPAGAALLVALAAVALAHHQVPAFAAEPPPAAAPAAPTQWSATPAQPSAPRAKTSPRHAAAAPAPHAAAQPRSASKPPQIIAPLSAIQLEVRARTLAGRSVKTLLTPTAQPFDLKTRVIAANAPLVNTYSIELAARAAARRIAPVAARDAVAALPSAISLEMRALAASHAAHPASTEDDFLDALAEAGYTHLSVDDLIAVRNAGVTATYLRALKQYGVTPMPVAKLIALSNAGVSPDLMSSLHAAGYPDMKSDDLVALANAGVTARFVSAMASAGIGRPSMQDLVALANAGVSDLYVQTLARNGYSKIGVSSMIALANAGVSTTFLIGMARLGYAGLSVDTLTALANAGVTPGYVKSLADLGYGNIGTQDLIRLLNAGVTAHMIETLRSHGIGANGKLSVDELIKLADEGF